MLQRHRLWVVLLSFAIAVLVAPATAHAGAKEPAVTVTGDAVILHARFPAPRFEATGDRTVPVIEGLPSFALHPGHPRLPLATYTVVLPPRTEVLGVKVAGQPVALPGAHRFAWAQEPRPINSPPAFDTPADPVVYGSDQPYPASPVTITGSGYFRGYHVVALSVRPVQVRPASGTALAWSDMEIRLRLGPTGADTSRPPRGLARDLDELARLAVNPETALSYASSGSESATAGTADEPYIIITTEAFAPKFQRLLDHRAAHGMPGEILTMETIEAGYPGRDRAEKVRNAIAQAYQDHGTTFVLLGGDDQADDGTPLIPVRHCAPSDNTPSDYYFGALDGDWDTDGDGTFCEANEVDYWTEVHIGRATVDTAGDIDNWIDKLLQYESGLPEERRTDLVWMGESLDAQTWGGDSKDETAKLIPDDPWVIERLYAKLGTFSKQNIMDSLNRGPHMTNHLGHANQSYVMGLSISDVESLTNDSPFFSYSQGCYAGAFDQGVSGNTEAISEHFLTTQHGAFGVVMNGRYGWYSPGSAWGPSQYFDHEFYDALFTEGLKTLGEANDDSRMDNASSAQSDGTMRYCFLETNLHGDPATPVQMQGAMLRYASHRVVDDDPGYGNCNGFAEPGETVQIAVTLLNQDDYDTATGVNAILSSSTPGVTVHDTWAGWPDIPPGQQAENNTHAFTASFDTNCGDRVTFQLEIRRDGGPSSISVFDMILGDEHEWDVLVDDFETDQGWTPGGDAIRGPFVRDDPHGVSDSEAGPVQPEDDATGGDGTTCWVTYNPEVGPGFEPGDGDVDSGTSYVQSPVFDGRGEGTLRMSYARWYHRSHVQSLDAGSYEADVSNDGGQTWAAIEHLENNASNWVRRNVDLTQFTTPSEDMALRFSAYDLCRMPGDPLNELLVDDVRVYRYAVYCDPFYSDDTLPPNPVSNSVTADRFGDDVVLNWIAPPEDPEHDPARFYPVYRSDSPAGGFTEVGEPCECGMHDTDAASDPGDVLYYVVAAKNSAGTSGEEPTP